MLVIKKELDLNDFRNEFMDELKDISSEGIEIIFDSLCNFACEDTADGVRGYLRYQLQHLSVSDVAHDYGYLLDGIDLEDLENPETLEAIEQVLDDRTYLMGSYKEDDETFFIFDEF